MPIACARTTGYSNAPQSQVSHGNLLRSKYTQACNQGNHSYTEVYQHINAHQMHPNAPYTHLNAIVSTSPVVRNNELRHA
jgi:hypothetical protein